MKSRWSWGAEESACRILMLMWSLGSLSIKPPTKVGQLYCFNITPCGRAPVPLKNMEVSINAAVGFLVVDTQLAHLYPAPYLWQHLRISYGFSCIGVEMGAWCCCRATSARISDSCSQRNKLQETEREIILPVLVLPLTCV